MLIQQTALGSLPDLRRRCKSHQQPQSALEIIQFWFILELDFNTAALATSSTYECLMVIQTLVMKSQGLLMQCDVRLGREILVSRTPSMYYTMHTFRICLLSRQPASSSAICMARSRLLPSSFMISPSISSLRWTVNRKRACCAALYFVSN